MNGRFTGASASPTPQYLKDISRVKRVTTALTGRTASMRIEFADRRSYLSWLEDEPETAQTLLRRRGPVTALP
jgi:hypothetical protein